MRGCEFDLLLDLAEEFGDTWRTKQTAAGVSFHSYRTYYDGFVYITLESPYRLARIAEEDGSVQVLAEYDHPFGRPQVTADGVYWSRYISGGLSPEGRTPVEGVIEAFMFDSTAVDQLFDTAILPEPPVTHEGQVVVATTDGIIQHPLGPGTWTTVVEFPNAEIHPTPNTHAGHLLVFQTDIEPHRLIGHELGTWHSWEIDVDQGPDLANVSTTLAGTSADYVFVNQDGKNNDARFTRTLVALDPDSDVERRPLRGEVRSTWFNKPVPVGKDLLLGFPSTESCCTSDLAILPNWESVEFGTAEALLVVQTNIQEFFVGKRFLLLITADGRLLRRALPTSE